MLNENDNSRRVKYYSIAGLTIQIESDKPIRSTTFHEKFNIFLLETPGNDVIRIFHHFFLPDLRKEDCGKLLYKKSPWEIYLNEEAYTYFMIDSNNTVPVVAVFNHKHSLGTIYHRYEDSFERGNLKSLTLLPTDQIILARILADRGACYLHAAGMILYGQGILFIGHSEAGKSTTVTMLKNEGEILCDDRIIVRRWDDGFRIHGTWSHGDVPDVSNLAAPLNAIFLIEKASTNEIHIIDDKKEIVRILPFYIIKPIVTADWWEKSLDLIGKIASEVPVYRLKLDKSGEVRTLLKEFLCKKRQ